jgi:hypothetical protein
VHLITVAHIAGSQEGVRTTRYVEGGMLGRIRGPRSRYLVDPGTVIAPTPNREQSHATMQEHRRDTGEPG